MNKEYGPSIISRCYPVYLRRVAYNHQDFIEATGKFDPNVLDKDSKKAMRELGEEYARREMDTFFKILKGANDAN